MQIKGTAALGAEGERVLRLDDVPLWAISDSVGAAPSRAAGLALEAMRAHVGLVRERARFADADATTDVHLALDASIELAVQAAERAVSDSRDAREWLAAGVVAASVAGHRLHVATVGSSRAYVYRAGEVHRINRDRSSHALGAGRIVDVDVAGMSLAEDDLVMLCTDGLAARLREDRLPLLLGNGDPDGAIGRLKDAAGHEPGALVLVRVGVDQTAVSAATLCRVLQSLFLFRGLTGPERLALMPYLEERLLAPEEVLMREGDPGDEFLAIVEGSVRVTRGSVWLRDIGPGLHLGELALSGSSRRSATAVAAEPTRVLAMSRQSFEILLARRPEIGARLAMALLHTVGERLRDLTHRVAQEG
jgi:serine/threonine protein phosphatase PrpC